jgi:uncharacterized protein YdeI (YjbR/CyaY-like superfamily)
VEVAPDGRPLVHPKSRRAWRAWLERNHATSDGVWLATFRTATGKPRVGYPEAVEEALCFGWIDSKHKRLDEERSILWMSPRSPASGLSKVNKERVARLEAAGLMAEPGSRAVEAARRSGAWSKLDSAESLEVPDDLAEAFRRNAAARVNYDAFPPSSKKVILFWIASAKRAETRARRIDETVRLAEQNLRANHPRP